MSNVRNKTITFRDLKGEKFGKLTVLKLDRIESRTRYWLCECDCELHNRKVVKETYLIGGQTQSCGCLKNGRKERFIFSNAIVTPENRKLYDIWKNIIHRCLNPDNNKYYQYGAKGITICKEWQDFNIFNEWCNDNGYKDGLSLIRKDIKGSYQPNNCVWDIKSNYKKIQNEYENLHLNNNTPIIVEQQEHIIEPVVKFTADKTPIEIALDIDENGMTTAKKLYNWLELDITHFARWCKKNIINNDFANENEDYLRLATNGETPTGGIIMREDYKITATFAKKLCMTAKCKKGEEARNYFITIEDKLKQIVSKQPQQQFNIPKTFSEALRMCADEYEKNNLLNKQVVEKEKIIELYIPKINAFNRMLEGKNSFTFEYAAKVLKVENMGEKKLFQKLRELNYLLEDNTPRQQYIDKGIFEVVVVPRQMGNYIKNCLQTLITPKGMEYIYNKFVEIGLINNDFKLIELQDAQ